MTINSKSIFLRRVEEAFRLGARRALGVQGDTLAGVRSERHRVDIDREFTKSVREIKRETNAKGYGAARDSSPAR